jgi:hypothetical protein
MTDRTRHHVWSTPHILLSLWPPDQTRRSREWPDTSVANPSPRASTVTLNWPDTPTASSYFDLSIRSLPVTSLHLCFYPRWLREILRLWRSGKYAFYFHKSVECANTTKCVNTTSFANVLTPPGVHHLVLMC